MLSERYSGLVDESFIPCLVKLTIVPPLRTIIYPKICKTSHSGYTVCYLPVTCEPMHMKTVTAVEAKNTFGRLLEATHREPVMVTKNNREVAAMLSMQDVQALADAFLAEPIKAEVAEGKRSVLDALMAQLEINKRLEASRAAIAEGKGVVADDGYFEGLRARAQSRLS